MEIVGITRLKDGKETNEFVVGCPEHQYWFKGLPPLTSGCRECWNAYYFAQVAIKGGNLSESVDQLESALRHAAELAQEGKFDFQPKLEDFKIEYEN